MYIREWPSKAEILPLSSKISMLLSKVVFMLLILLSLLLFTVAPYRKSYKLFYSIPFLDKPELPEFTQGLTHALLTKISEYFL